MIWLLDEVHTVLEHMAKTLLMQSTQSGSYEFNTSCLSALMTKLKPSQYCFLAKSPELAVERATRFSANALRVDSVMWPNALAVPSRSVQNKGQHKENYVQRVYPFASHVFASREGVVLTRIAQTYRIVPTWSCFFA